ncbi:MAG: hypothetical protein WCO28_11565 [Bacteroidota bacterium]
MKKVNSTSSVKIQIAQNEKISGICMEQGIHRSDFFINALIKAIKMPYTGHVGMEKLRFQPFGRNKKELHLDKPRYRLIGARLCLKLKTQVLVICKLYSISESQFYRWALDLEILQYRKTRNAPLKPILMPVVPKKLLQPYPKSEVQLFLEESQRNAFETYKTAKVIGNLAGLISALVAGSPKQ